MKTSSCACTHMIFRIYKMEDPALLSVTLSDNIVVVKKKNPFKFFMSSVNSLRLQAGSSDDRKAICGY